MAKFALFKFHLIKNLSVLLMAFIIGIPAISTALTFSDVQWRTMPFPVNFPYAVTSVWSNGPNDVWIGATDPNGPTNGYSVSFAHWNGDSWTVSPSITPSFYPNSISGVRTADGSQAVDVWAAGDGGRYARWNPSTQQWDTDWVKNSSFTYKLVGVGAVSSSDVTVFSASTTHRHWNGSIWEDRYYGAAYNPTKGGAYFGGKVWASGPCGTLLACTSSGCGQASGPVCSWGQFIDVWGTALNNYWVTSSSGYIARYNGSWWATPVNSIYTGLNGIWGSATNDIWFVGQGGKMFHWDGSQVWGISSVTNHDLTDIHGTASDEIWAVGHDVILHYTNYISEAAARLRVVQECSFAMTGSHTQYDETTWPGGPGDVFATHNYTELDLVAWNLLINSGRYSAPPDMGHYVSCLKTFGGTARYGPCNVTYGSDDMPNYTCQGNCNIGHKKGGQCKAFMNLIAYRSGVYQNSNLSWASFPSDPDIDNWSEGSGEMPKASYSNLESGDFLRKPDGHALIVIRKFVENNVEKVLVFDSNWHNGNEEVLSHEMTVGSLGSYRILKCVYNYSCQ